MFNPLLSQNMGRWAEVYFTHPPEEREQAVRELVYQLERENRERKSHVTHSSDRKENEEMEQANSTSGVVCRGCGYRNPVSQRYCGQCGVVLANPAGMTLERIPPTAAMPAAPGTLGEETWTESEVVGDQTEEKPQHYFLEERRGEYVSDIEPPTFGYDGPSISYSYRVFLGLALAIVLGVLGYMAWHRGQSGLNLAQEAPQATPVTTDQPAPSDQASSKDTATPNQAAPAKSESAPTTAKAEVAAAPATASKTAEADTNARKPESVPEPVPAKKATLTPAAKTERIQSNGNGAEELAIAEKYLNGETGRRDPSQAAQWLWKSVAKQNTEATLLLADLYLHGEGIQKNCDQARILLDAAAQKGQAGAATRLRNMQAFGCQ
jgi:hypothetical protein